MKTHHPRCFTVIAILRTSGRFVGNGLDRSGRFAATANFPGGVGSPRPTGQYKSSRGRGGASPARDKMETTNLRVLRRGGIYAARAAARMLRYNGKTARDAYMRPLQTCRKFAFPQLLLTSRLFVGRGLDPSLPFCGNRQFPRRGGVTPPYGAIQIIAR